MHIGIYPTLVLILLTLAIIFSQPRKRWKCPQCDFSVEEHKEGLAKAHKELHAKHVPALKPD